MTKRFHLALLTSACFAVVAAPGTASALRSYQGNDFSEDYDNVHRVRICDNESDGNGAYVRFRPRGTTSDSQFQDSNGSRAGCTGSAYFGGIYRHKACEDVSLRPDYCGQYVYP
jgi:hypothetical protein